MQIIGRVESLWRYPVKSLGGEQAEKVFLGFAGVYGDRIYAFANDAAPAGFPFLTGRNRPEMLLYQASYRHPDLGRLPPNLAGGGVRARRSFSCSRASSLGSGRLLCAVMTAMFGPTESRTPSFNWAGS